jgi:hypothetical protein
MSTDCWDEKPAVMTSSTRVADVGLAHLAVLSDLRSLSFLGIPGLTDAGLAHLAGLGQLEALIVFASALPT